MQTTILSTKQEWTKIFPKQVTENYTNSVAFMKQLTVVALSAITYLKDVFPADSYTIEKFGGITLRILRQKCRDESAHFLSTALIQAFDAFDKKYLRQLALCFYEDECKPENLVEYHVFEYYYHENGVSMNVHSKSRNSARLPSEYSFEYVKERTLSMIKACILLNQSSQHQLPASYDFCLRLYYNEDAPEGYQAPGFHSGDDYEDHLVATRADAVQFGFVDTPFHTLHASTYIKEDFSTDRGAATSQSQPVTADVDMEGMTGSSRRLASGDTWPALYCPCNICSMDQLDDLTELITCSYCKRQQHAICFGLLSGSRVAEHCCTACSDAEPSRRPTDPRLVTKDQRQREFLCLTRLALAWCVAHGHVSLAQLTALGLPPEHATYLLEYLRAQHALPPCTQSEDFQKIDQGLLQKAMQKFFPNSRDQDIVERLMAETFASQERQSDPVGEVLSPLEMASLRTATNVGRLVQAPQAPAVGDTTLLEYQEAISSSLNDDEDIPLDSALEQMKLEKRKRKTSPEKPTLKFGVKSKRFRVTK